MRLFFVLFTLITLATPCLAQDAGLMPANTVFAGPTSGGAAFGTARAIVAGDINGLVPSFGGLTLSNLTGSGTSCVQVNNSGVFSLTGSACGSGSGAVNSVSNSDGTLTFSPTTGLVVGSLNLGHANTWTAKQTFSPSIQVPLVIGGAGAASTLTLESTSGAGTSDAIFFKTASQVEHLRVDTAGNAIISNGGSALQWAGPLEIDHSDGQTNLSLLSWNNTINSPQIWLGQSRGTSIGSQIALISGDVMGNIFAIGSDGAGFNEAALIQFTVSGSVSTGHVPSQIDFFTSSTSGVLANDALRIDNAGRTIPADLAGVAIVFTGMNGVVGDGTTDDAAAIFSLLASFGEVHIYPGNYAIKTSKTIGSGKKIVFHQGATFSVSTGVTWDFSASDVENPMDNQAFALAGTGKVVGLMNATPEEFGAARNGSTDDSAALSACFKSVSTSTSNRIVGNPTCWLSQGTYAIASQVTVSLPAAGTLRIQGGGQWGQPTEILSKTSVSGTALVITGLSQVNAVISGFQIVNQTHGSGAGQGLYIGTNSGILLNGSEQPGSVMVDHMYVSGFATNYLFQAIGGVQVQFSQSWGLDSAGGNTTNGIGMRATTASGIGGTQVDFTSNVIIGDNSAGYIGIELDDGGNASTSTTGCRLINNVIYNGTGGGTGMLMQSSGSSGLVFDIWLEDGNQFESQQVGGTTGHPAINMVVAGGGTIQDIHINHVYMSGQGWNNAINAQINDSSSFLATIWITNNLMVATGTSNEVLLSGTSSSVTHMHGITVSNNIFYVSGSLNTLGAFQYGQDFTVMGNVTTLAGSPTIATGFSFFNTGNNEAAIGNVTHATTPVFTSWTTTANANNL